MDRKSCCFSTLTLLRVELDVRIDEQQHGAQRIRVERGGRTSGACSSSSSRALRHVKHVAAHQFYVVRVLQLTPEMDDKLFACRCCCRSTRVTAAVARRQLCRSTRRRRHIATFTTATSVAAFFLYSFQQQQTKTLNKTYHQYTWKNSLH